MPSIRHTSPLLRYGVAVLAVGVAFGLKLLLDPLIVQDVPFLLVFGAIMVSAWFGGLGPGLLATVAAGLTTDYFFLDPRGTVSGFSLEDVPLLAFFLEGTLVCLLAEALRAARLRAESSNLEAKRHRERLCRNEEHFRSLVEGMRNYAIFTLDPQGCVASWNAGAELREGYTSEEIVGEHFSLFFTEEDTRLGKPEEHLEAAASEGRSAEENWLVRKDGSRFWADTILTALHDDEDKLRGFSVVTQDITEKKEAERNLEEAEDRLRTLVEHEPAITYTGEVGGDHALDYVSPQIEEVLGNSPGEVMETPTTGRRCCIRMTGGGCLPRTGVPARPGTHSPWSTGYSPGTVVWSGCATRRCSCETKRVTPSTGRTSSSTSPSERWPSRSCARARNCTATSSSRPPRTSSS